MPIGKADDACVAVDGKPADRHLRAVIADQRIGQREIIGDARDVSRRRAATEDDLVEHRAIQRPIVGLHPLPNDTRGRTQARQQNRFRRQT